MARVAVGTLDVADAIAPLRDAAGDTDATVAQVKDHNAAVEAVCPAPAVVGGQ